MALLDAVLNGKDWQQNTVYRGYYHFKHRVIKWFWMAIHSFPNLLRLRCIEFVTGTLRVPRDDLAELRSTRLPFTIQSWGDYKQLPRAQTRQ